MRAYFVRKKLAVKKCVAYPLVNYLGIGSNEQTRLFYGAFRRNQSIYRFDLLFEKSHPKIRSKSV
jgi:hypothetical protein